MIWFFFVLCQSYQWDALCSPVAHLAPIAASAHTDILYGMDRQLRGLVHHHCATLHFLSFSIKTFSFQKSLLNLRFLNLDFPHLSARLFIQKQQILLEMLTVCHLTIHRIKVLIVSYDVKLNGFGIVDIISSLNILFNVLTNHK